MFSAQRPNAELPAARRESRSGCRERRSDARGIYRRQPCARGLFEAGSLFLDEAGEMSMAAQAKLLRVLTDGLVLRIGSTKPRQVDVRLIVASIVTYRNGHRRVFFVRIYTTGSP
ncbi:MAG TPA: sigma 54-interacting transcriptional regulator [Candidatus Binataceae bacterium]|nr:sigma 54-interacting transcriptional regulator [Candidatus Binataceae bacterium]